MITKNQTIVNRFNRQWVQGSNIYIYAYESFYWKLIEGR